MPFPEHYLRKESVEHALDPLLSMCQKDICQFGNSSYHPRRKRRAEIRRITLHHFALAVTVILGVTGRSVLGFEKCEIAGTTSARIVLLDQEDIQCPVLLN